MPHLEHSKVCCYRDLKNGFVGHAITFNIVLRDDWRTSVKMYILLMLNLFSACATKKNLALDLLGIHGWFMRIENALIILRECAGGLEFSLFCLLQRVILSSVKVIKPCDQYF